MTRKPTPSLLSGLLLLALLLISATGSALVAQTCPTASMPAMFPPAPGAFTYTAVADGGWRLPTTWGGTTTPGNGDIVCIPAGRTVTVNRQETARLRYIQVDGTLKMAIASDTRLLVDTLLVDVGGSFVIGGPLSTQQPGVTAELVFISWDGNPIDRTWDPEEKSRGLISMGTVKVYGDPKTHMEPMTADGLKGSTHLVVDSAPSNWKVGDKLVLTGSYFREVAGAAPTSQDEPIEITAITGSAIDFKTVPANGALIYDHVRARSDLHLHVANLTRNVVFRSEVPATSSSRGHLMMMTGDVVLSNAALLDLGRTDKTRPLDDVVVKCKIGGVLKACDGNGTQTDYSVVANAVNAVTNRRGRYAIHFHLNGISPGSPSPSTVINSVVSGTPGGPSSATAARWISRTTWPTTSPAPASSPRRGTSWGRSTTTSRSAAPGTASTGRTRSSSPIRTAPSRWPTSRSAATASGSRGRRSAPPTTWPRGATAWG
jgi:hypothetical protein